MKRFALLIVFLGISLTGFAQDDEKYFYFQDRTHELETVEIDETGMRSHSFGVDIARKFQLMKDTYTWRDLGDATNPTERTVVEKSVIYYSFKKVDKFLKKEVKAGAMEESQAIELLTDILNKGYCMRFQNTVEFESALRDAKKGDQIMELYNSVVLR